MKKELEIEKPKNVELKNPKMMKEAPQDVEMKDAEKKEEDNEEKKDVDLLTLEGIQLCFAFVLLVHTYIFVTSCFDDANSH